MYIRKAKKRFEKVLALFFGYGIIALSKQNESRR